MEFLSLLLPIVIDLINRKVPDTDARFWIAVGVCSLVGTGFNWLETQFIFATPMFAFDSVTKSIMVAFGLAQLSYKAVWENLDVRNKMGLNAKTN